MDIGDFGVTRTGGFVAWCIRHITHSTVNHAFIYVGDGQIVQAQPGGAVLSPASDYPNAQWSKRPLPLTTRYRIAQVARSVIGTPYNWLDVVAQAFVRLFGWVAPQWAQDRLSDPKTLQCAQLVDYCYWKAGVDLFGDWRPAGLVAPSDLKDLIDHG